MFAIYSDSHRCRDLAVYFLHIAFGLPPALSSLQFLMIDLGTELHPALSFSYKGVEDDIMSMMPRNQVVQA